MGLQQTNNSFHWADYVVLALSLLLSCSVGIYFAFSGGRQKTTSEYLMGNRSMRLVPVSISLVASFLSAILILGHPAETYLNGVGAHFTLIGAAMAYLLAAGLFVTMLYPLRLTSAFEYLEKRFQSKLVRCIGTLLNLVNMTMYAGMATFAPCTATERVTGNAVRREVVIGLCGLIGTSYTLLGGIKAVVWVDAMQAGIMLSGTLAVAVMAVIDCGGWQAMWQLNAENGRLQVPSLTLDPWERHSMWGMTIGVTFYWLSALGVSQASVQRYCSMPSIRASRMTMLLGLPGHCLMVTVCTLVGMAIFGRYASVACDIHGAGWADKNQIVTYYVMERMNAPGFPGLFTAALFAAALSSVSSSLSSASTIAWTDLLKPYVCKKVPDSSAAIVAKALVAAFGLTSTLIAYLVAQLGGTIIQAVSTFIGSASGPSLGLFLLGGLFPRANWFGATAGPLAGLACGVWVGAGAYAISRQNVQLPSNITGCEQPQDAQLLLGLLANSSDIAATAAAYTTASPVSSSSSSISSGLFNVTTAAVGASPGGLQGFLVEYIYTISYIWTPLIGVLVTLTVGMLCSYLAEKGKYFGFIERTKVQDNHLLPGVVPLLTVMGCDGNIVAGEIGEDSSEHPESQTLPVKGIELQMGATKIPI